MLSSNPPERIITSTPLLSTSPRTTHDYSKQLLLTGAFADCTIICRGRSWPVHCNILSPRCDFFQYCLDGRFSEGRAKVITMEDDDPIAVDGMVWYLYTMDYPLQVYLKILGRGTVEMGSGSDSGIEDEESTAMIQNARIYWAFDLLMYSIADKYGLPELRELAGKSLLGKAKLAGNENELLKTMDGFVALLEDLYTMEDVSDRARRLRRDIVATTSEALTRCVRDDRLSGLMADVPEFSIELVEALCKEREETRRTQGEEDKKREALRVRLSHIPMNDESDDDD